MNKEEKALNDNKKHNRVAGKHALENSGHAEPTAESATDPMKTKAKAKRPEISQEMRNLVEQYAQQLARAMANSQEIVFKLLAQGRKECLTLMQIRQLCWEALERKGLHATRIRQLLPDELKHKSMARRPRLKEFATLSVAKIAGAKLESSIVETAQSATKSEAASLSKAVGAFDQKDKRILELEAQLKLMDRFCHEAEDKVKEYDDILDMVRGQLGDKSSQIVRLEHLVDDLQCSLNDKNNEIAKLKQDSYFENKPIGSDRTTFGELISLCNANLPSRIIKFRRDPNDPLKLHIPHSSSGANPNTSKTTRLAM
jgi:hypothetical protein